MYNYFLNIAIDICLKTLIRVRNEMENIEGRISVNDIEPKSCGAYLFLTKPGDILPIIKIIVHIADTELENNEIAKDINDKIAIERLIADIDYKIVGAIERMILSVRKYWDEIIKEINRIAEEKKLNTRYTSLFELQNISIDSRKSLNKLRQEILDEKKHV